MKSTRGSAIREQRRNEQIDVLGGQGRGDPDDRALRWRDLTGSTALAAIMIALGKSTGFQAITEEAAAAVVAGVEDAAVARADANAQQLVAVSEASQEAATNLLNDATALLGTSESILADTETARDAAAASATNAQGSATSASGSATTATSKATDAQSSADAAAGSATTAATAAGNASTSAAQASQSEQDAAQHTATAATAAGAATASANTAAGHETNAAASENNAATSATTASGAASVAVSAQQTAVQVAQQGSGVLVDQFFGYTIAPTNGTIVDPGIYPSGRTIRYDLNSTTRGLLYLYSNAPLYWVGPEYGPAYRIEIEIGCVAGEALISSGVVVEWFKLDGSSRSVETPLADLAGPDVLAPGSRGIYSGIFVDPDPLATDFDYIVVSFATNDNRFGPKSPRTVELHRLSVVAATITDASTSAIQASLADLEGNAAASLVFRAKAGGAVGEVEIVAADDPINGAASLVRIAATTILLDGSVEAQSLAAGSVTADAIQAGVITTAMLNAGNFNAAGVSVFGGQLKSSNYAAGSAGWSITDAGAAEFNSLVVRTGNIGNNAVTKTAAATDNTTQTVHQKQPAYTMLSLTLSGVEGGTVELSGLFEWRNKSMGNIENEGSNAEVLVTLERQKGSGSYTTLRTIALNTRLIQQSTNSNGYTKETAWEQIPVGWFDVPDYNGTLTYRLRGGNAAYTGSFSTGAFSEFRGMYLRATEFKDQR